MTEQFTSSDNEEKNNQKKSLSFLINLISECVERGGFTLSDVLKINESINNFTKNDSNEESQQKSIINIINYINISQNKGKLTLEEAYESYKAISCFK